MFLVCDFGGESSFFPLLLPSRLFFIAMTSFFGRTRVEQVFKCDVFVLGMESVLFLYLFLFFYCNYVVGRVIFMHMDIIFLVFFLFKTRI